MTAAAWFVAGWCVGFALRRWNRTRIAVVRYPGTGIGDATMALQCALDESSIVRFEPGAYTLRGRVTVQDDDDNDNHGV